MSFIIWRSNDDIESDFGRFFFWGPVHLFLGLPCKCIHGNILRNIYLSPNWWWITYWCIDNIAWAESQQSSFILKKQKCLWWILLSAGRLLCPSRFIYDMATHNSLRFGNGTNNFEHTIWKRLLYITLSITATSIYTVLHIGFKKTTVRS